MIGKLLCKIGSHNWETIGGKYLKGTPLSVAIAEECKRCKRREYVHITAAGDETNLTAGEFIRMINQ